MSTDDVNLPELTQRQEEILSYIIQAYTVVPEPISSKYLVDTFHLAISSATIRNEMSALEDMGYVHAPHTSAGRVPTKAGYRYFVKHLMDRQKVDALSSGDQQWIDDRLKNTSVASEQQMAQAANALARVTHTAALVTAPRAKTNRFKHTELIAIQGRLVLMVLVLQGGTVHQQGRLVLMVLVLQGGTVHQQMLTLSEPIAQPRLSETADLLNSLLPNLSESEVRMRGGSLSALGRDIADLVADAMQRSDTSQSRQVYGDGLSEMITSFPNSEGAQQAIRVIEERAFLHMILDDMLTPLINQVQVLIAGDGRWEELSHLSLVLSRYGVEGKITGAVGVLGPTHLNYHKAIGVVSYVSGVMTDLLSDVYATLPEATVGETTDED